MGIGGSVFHWHPEHRISFVFLPTYLDWTDFAMKRGVKLRDIVFDCVLDMKKAKNAKFNWIKNIVVTCAQIFVIYIIIWC